MKFFCYNLDLPSKTFHSVPTSFSNKIYSKHVKSSTNDPFFMYLAFQSVHKPIQVPKKYIRMYKHLNKKDEKRVEMMAMVTALDEAIGKIVKKLKKEGLFKNTFFLFTSDVSKTLFTAAEKNRYPLIL